MGKLSNECGCNPQFENIDIYCLRMLAEKILKSTPLLFNVKDCREIPIDICIKPCPCPADIEKKAAQIIWHEGRKLQELIENNAPTDELINVNEKIAKLICGLKCIEKCCDKEIKCIEDIKVFCVETSEDFICNHKVRLIIKFKVILIVKFTDCTLGLLLLPENECDKFCFNDINFPVKTCCDGIKKILNLDRCKKSFVLTIEIPLKQFHGTLPPDIFDDPTIESKIMIKNLKNKFDIWEGPCTCDPASETHISLFITADITDKIGIKQDIWIQGSPD